MDNPEKLAIQSTQGEENQKKNTTQYVLDTKLFLSSSLSNFKKQGQPIRPASS
jgi:hypothetical protein